MASNPPPQLADLLRYGRAASINELCLPHSLAADALQQVRGAGMRELVLQGGERLFSQGQGLHALHIVTRGLVETSVLDQQGHLQVTGFHYPADLVGLDAFHEREHVCTATAVGASAVRVVPLHRLEAVMQRVPGLRDALERAISKTLAEHEQLLMVVNQRPAVERVAIFLFTLACRLGHDGRPALEFPLGMSRVHMANYLGLARETVLRALDRLERARVVQRTANGRRLRVTDMAALAGFA